MFDRIKRRIKSDPRLKAWVLYLLRPKNRHHPRLWVRLFLNPLIHKKGGNALIRKRTVMDVMPFNDFALGKDSTIEDFATVNNGMGPVIIGDRCRVGISNVLIGPVKIGDDVIIAQNVVISGLNHGYEDISVPIRKQPCTTREITIDDEAWIGANVVITAGVTIGKHAVVAAGSVVTKDVKPYSIVAGNPAKVIREYSSFSNQWEKIERELKVG